MFLESLVRRRTYPKAASTLACLGGLLSWYMRPNLDQVFVITDRLNQDG